MSTTIDAAIIKALVEHVGGDSSGIPMVQLVAVELLIQLETVLKLVMKMLFLLPIISILT